MTSQSEREAEVRLDDVFNTDLPKSKQTLALYKKVLERRKKQGNSIFTQTHSREDKKSSEDKKLSYIPRVRAGDGEQDIIEVKQHRTPNKAIIVTASIFVLLFIVMFAWHFLSKSVS